MPERRRSGVSIVNFEQASADWDVFFRFLSKNIEFNQECWPSSLAFTCSNSVMGTPEEH